MAMQGKDACTVIYYNQSLFSTNQSFNGTTIQTFPYLALEFDAYRANINN